MNKTIVVTGATGFVGTKLCLELFKKGYNLKILCRSTHRAQKLIPLPVEYVVWDGTSELSPEIFENTYAVVHLAGESIAEGRWTKARKQKIRSSRVDTTKNICGAINACQNPPQIMVGASAIGIYGDRGNEILSEESPVGVGFLAEVCKAWEDSYKTFKGRIVLLRTGIVLGHGGALKKMLLPFRLGGGGKLASGRQWMSWIHIDDLVKMYIYSIENSDVTGATNAVSPESLTNKEFTKKLATSLGIPALFPVPSLALKVIFGEMSSILVHSQRVAPDKILKLNFKFDYPTLALTFDSLLAPGGHKGSHTFSVYQWLPKKQEEVFSFFSMAENLEVITPPWLNFKIIRKSNQQIHEGTIIDYKLKIKGIPAFWRTLISKWSPPHYFTDSQLKGPYAKWIHTHHFIQLENGTLMIDEVIYKVPLGPIGHITREILIVKDVEKIFEYRNAKIVELFGPKSKTNKYP